jgi:hypothetical protein
MVASVASLLRLVSISLALISPFLLRGGFERPELSLKDQPHEEAAGMLAILEDTLRLLEKHRDVIRSWLERGE